MTGSASVGIGIVGLSDRPGSWAATAHWPAIQAVSDLEVRGLATTSMASAARAAQRFGVKSAFDDVTALARQDDIDLLVVCVKIPDHRNAVLAAASYGKPIFCEWPLARNTLEAVELMSAAQGQTFVGLQGRSAPFVRFLQDIVGNGDVGEVLSSTLVASSSRWGDEIDAGLEWTLDSENGATMMSIPFAHALDVVSTVLGDLADLVATVDVRRSKVRHTLTGERLPRNVEDQIAVTGHLELGGLSTVVYRGGATQTTQFSWEILGTAGEIRVTSASGHIQRGTQIRIRISDGSDAMPLVAVPARFDAFPELRDTPAYTVAHGYRDITSALHGRQTGRAPASFADAVALHQLLDYVRRAGVDGIRVRPSQTSAT